MIAAIILAYLRGHWQTLVGAVCGLVVVVASVLGDLLGRVIGLPGADGGVPVTRGNTSTAQPLLLVDRPAAVVAAEVRPEAGERVANAIREAGGRCLVVPTDVGDTESVRQMVARAEEIFDLVRRQAQFCSGIRIVQIREDRLIALRNQREAAGTTCSATKLFRWI